MSIPFVSTVSATLLVFACSLSSARVASAQASVAAAESLFNDARAAMTNQQYDIACDKFRESDRLDPALGTRFNLANCEEHRGRLATAWALYREVLNQLPVGDSRAVIARERRQALDARVPRLTIQVHGEVPVGTTVTVAGLVLGAASFGSLVAIDPGAYELLVNAPGRASRASAITLAEGESAVFVVALEAASPLTARTRPASTPSNSAAFAVGCRGALARGPPSNRCYA